jgi:hypothetical protein
MAKYPHVIWKDAAVLFSSGNPLLPFYATRSIELNSVTATSASNLTAFATYYDFWFAGTTVLDALGKAEYGPAWWSDLLPVWSILTQPTASPPYPSVWPIGNSETHAPASGGFDLSIYDTPVDNTTGFATQTAVWHAAGHTEGMRTLPGPAGAQTVLLVGINYNSYAAGYGVPVPNTTWTSGGYFKTGFGSQNTIF